MIQVSFVKNALFCVLVFVSVQSSMKCMAGQDEEVYRALAHAVFEKLEETNFEQLFKATFPQPSYAAVLALSLHIDKLYKPKGKFESEDQPPLGAIIGEKKLLLLGNVVSIIRDIFSARQGEPIDIRGYCAAPYRAMKKAALEVSNSKWKLFACEFASDCNGEISPLGVLILATYIKGCGMRSHDGAFEILVGETKIQLSGDFAQEVLAAFQLVQYFAWR